METSPAGPWRVQMMNFTVYHLLISLANLLNLPLPDGTYVPRRGARLTVYQKDIALLKMLKGSLDADDPVAVRAYLVAVKHLVFEARFLLEQEPTLSKNVEFFEGFERLETLVHAAQDTSDFREVAALAYRLSILLPFYEDEDALADRRRQAEAWDARERKRGRG